MVIMEDRYFGDIPHTVVVQRQCHSAKKSRFNHMSYILGPRVAVWDGNQTKKLGSPRITFPYEERVNVVWYPNTHYHIGMISPGLAQQVDNIVDLLELSAPFPFFLSELDHID